MVLILRKLGRCRTTRATPKVRSRVMSFCGNINGNSATITSASSSSYFSSFNTTTATLILCCVIRLTLLTCSIRPTAAARSTSVRVFTSRTDFM